MVDQDAGKVKDANEIVTEQLQWVTETFVREVRTFITLTAAGSHDLANDAKKRYAERLDEFWQVLRDLTEQAKIDVPRVGINEKVSMGERCVAVVRRGGDDPPEFIESIN